MMFLKETANAPQLKASMPDEEYLDALSAPRIEPGGKSNKKTTPRRKRMLPVEESSSAAESRPPAIAKASPKGKGKKAAEPKE
jgi:DNA-directed RNA polymerase-3 subunit RPC5